MSKLPMLAVSLLIATVIFSGVGAEGEWEQLPRVPPGLTYKPASPEQLQETASRLQATLRGKSQKPLSGQVVTCGPGLWRAIQSEKLTSVQSIACEFKPGGPGRIFRSDSELVEVDRLLEQLTTRWQPQGPIAMRNPTTEELVDFWSVISFDITEPLLIAEIGPHRLLFYFTQQKPTWIDEFPINLQKKRPSRSDPFL